MLPNRPSGMCGTPVPKRDVELRSKGSGPVITYRLSPEELKEYLQHLNDPVKREKPFMFLRKQQIEKEEIVVSELTKEEYLRRRLEGKGRTEIQKQYFPNNSNRFYRTLKEWGIREKEDEEKELKRLRDKQPQQINSDQHKETAEKMFSQDLQQDLPKDAIVERLDQLLAEKTARIKELEKAVTQLQAERDALLQTVEKAVDTYSDQTSEIKLIDVIDLATEGLTGVAAYCTGAVIQHLCAWKSVEDLKKARWHLDQLIEEAAK